jgi:hypothetical protein
MKIVRQLTVVFGCVVFAMALLAAAIPTNAAYEPVVYQG